MALAAGLRGILQTLQSDIILNVQLKQLLPILRNKSLVTLYEFEQLSIDGKETDSNKNERLLRIIIGKGENAFDLFVAALQEETEHLGHASLARRLLQEQKQLKPSPEGRPRFRPPEPLPRNSRKPTAPIPPPKPNTTSSTTSQVSLLGA